MLQQTRAAAVLPYYERFLKLFPSVEALAEAPEQKLLSAWAGLGYYSRARNLQRAARQIMERGGFPRDYSGIRELAGVGDYTAAAIGSIAFGVPRAAVDGNVIRVLSRVGAGAGMGTVRAMAEALLDRRRPGDFNQAMMELGATICALRQPQCLLCPVAEHCAARKLGRQSEFPRKTLKAAPIAVEQRLLVIRKNGALLLWQRGPDSKRMAGFWELPSAEQLPMARLGEVLGRFRHTIVNTQYRFEVVEATVRRSTHGFDWIREERFGDYPLSTICKKALSTVARIAGCYSSG